MLNPFPELLALAFFAPFLIRLGVGYAFLSLAFNHFKARGRLVDAVTSRYQFFAFAPWLLIAAEGAIALMFVAGLQTQIAATIGFTICLKLPFIRKWYKEEAFAPHPRLFYVLLALATLSLLLSGAGALAVDIPL